MKLPFFKKLIFSLLLSCSVLRAAEADLIDVDTIPRGRLAAVFKGKDVFLEVGLYREDDIRPSSQCDSRSGQIHCFPSSKDLRGPPLILKELWVCFNHHDVRPDSRFGGEYFTKRGIDAAYIHHKDSHWYQTHEMDKIISIINKITQTIKYDEIVGYGSSMGGYGALLFANQLHLTKCLVFCPQVNFQDLDGLVA